jgi:hypothetical protein
MKKAERIKISKQSRAWFEEVQKTIPLKLRVNNNGSFYLPATKSGYRWFVGMPSIFNKEDITFRVYVQKRCQLTKTNYGFFSEKTYKVNALSLPGMLTQNPEDYL